MKKSYYGHYCPDWDRAGIDEDMIPEFSCCTCNKEEILKSHIDGLREQLKAKDELIEKAIEEITYWKQMTFLKSDLNDHNLIECYKETDLFIKDLEKSLKGE